MIATNMFIAFPPDPRPGNSFLGSYIRFHGAVH
jgi:hypothetical protein